jgi:NAD(P)-dependent dehydrogenase (short-subunit alcohol dehydrogenase family)
MEKVALITGTSSGIGLSAAVLLGQAGFHVVATMRDLAKSGPLKAHAEVAGVKLSLRQLDVQDDGSIESSVSDVIAEHGRIDVLVNNAGAGYLGTLEQIPNAALRRTMDINFFGVWRVTRAVLPLMRAAGSGRIITVSSVGGVVGQVFNDAYCAAKFAVEGMMESLAPVAKRLGVHVSLVEPGPVNTEFVLSVQKAVDASPHASHPTDGDAYATMMNAYVAVTRQAFAAVGQTPDEVGRVIVEAATVAEPHFRYVTSDMAREFVARKFVDTTGDSVVALSGARLP